MRHHAGIHLVHPRVQSTLITRELVPGGDPRRARRQPRPGRHHAPLQLAGEDALAHGLPPVVEHSPVPVAPLRRHVVRRVRCGRREIQKERPVRSRLALIADQLDGLIREVLAQVIAVPHVRRRRDGVVVSDQRRGPLIRLRAQEAVIALEPQPERPPRKRAGGAALTQRRQMPLPHRERAVTGVPERPRERRHVVGQTPRVPRRRPGHFRE